MNTVPGPPADVEHLGAGNVLIRASAVAGLRALVAIAVREVARRDGAGPGPRARHLLAVLDQAAGVRADVRPLADPALALTVGSMTTVEVADILGLSTRQARRAAPALGAVRTTGGWLFDPELVRADRRRRLRTGHHLDNRETA